MTTLPEGTRMGPVTLRIRDLRRALAFWQGVLGLEVGEAGDAAAAVPLRAPGGGAVLVRLLDAPDAPPRPPGAAGLFHVAFRVPDRAALGRALRALGSSGWPLQGASDHAVSEAVYLADPEGNGVEIYADRPRDAWAWREGEVVMVTEPMDAAGVLAAGRGQPPAGGALGPGTVVGHVHLRVSALASAEAFWGPEGVGFDVTTRSYPGALFLAAAGYHHHVGANVWGQGSQRGGGGPASGEAAGLAATTVHVPGPATLEAVAARLGIAPGTRPDGGEPSLRVRDPDGTPLTVEVAPPRGAALPRDP